MSVNNKMHIAAMCVALPILLGMEGGGCAGSTAPLTERKDGFVDPYLVGEWYEFEDQATDSDDEKFSLDNFGPGELVYRVFVNGHGELRVQNYRDGALFEEFAAWSSLLRGDKYLNLLRLDCPGCDEEQRDRRARDVCPYQIVRYHTFIPDSWVDMAREDLRNEDISEAQLQAFFSRLHGNSVGVMSMDGAHVRRAMKAGEIEAFEYCENCKSLEVCVDVSAASLAEFVQHDRDELFDPDPWAGEIYLRAEAAVKKREAVPTPPVHEETTPGH